MKIIVTGGDGFIGKALVRALRILQQDVIVVDRKSGNEAGEYFMNHSLEGLDCVYHLAAQTSVFNSNKGDIIRDNIEAFKIVCDTCKRYGVKLIYASSSTANQGNTTSLYGISKRFDEEYAQCYNPDAIGVRFHNVYGSNPRKGTLLWYLLNNERVKLYNEGKNVRHFTYLNDIVAGLTYIGMDLDLPYPPLVNISNPQECTTLQFAHIVNKYKPIEIQCVEEVRAFDRVSQCVNDDIYTLPLHYTSVEEGIKWIFKEIRK